jgi:hypothetical protein
MLIHPWDGAISETEWRIFSRARFRAARRQQPGQWCPARHPHPLRPSLNRSGSSGWGY